MTITEASKLLKTFQTQSKSKSEKKVYSCFLRILSSLNTKDLTENQSQLIQQKISSLNLKTDTSNRKKYIRKRLSELKAFLKSEFAYTTEKYYTEIGMVYGMSIGIALGISIGSGIDPVLGISLGISMGVGIGMAFGMIYGAKKDAEAKKLGRII
jgi:tetrahydromethanopterin S-methyltransferase subunit G